MRIIVDADSCPSRDIIEKAAKESNIEVIMYCDISHIITSEFSVVKVVDSGFQSVDIKIANGTQNGDIVITQDYGVAAMALAKGAFAISPKGYIYDDNNIDRLLFERHLSYKARISGEKTSNPKKRTDKDDERLYINLVKLIKKA